MAMSGRSDRIVDMISTKTIPADKIAMRGVIYNPTPLTAYIPSTIGNDIAIANDPGIENL